MDRRAQRRMLLLCRCSQVADFVNVGEDISGKREAQTESQRRPSAFCMLRVVVSIGRHRKDRAVFCRLTPLGSAVSRLHLALKQAGMLHTSEALNHATHRGLRGQMDGRRCPNRSAVRHNLGPRNASRRQQSQQSPWRGHENRG